VATIGCGAVAKIAGVPSRDITTITVDLPSTILVGDTVQATATAKDGSGRPVETAFVWRSSDPGSVSVDGRGRVVGSSAGIQATIFAEASGKSGSAVVAIGDDQRLGYAVGDQPSAPGPYLPDPNFRHSSTGASIEITRPSTGVYTVRFIGLGRQAGQRDNVQVTGLGGAAGVYCKVGGWQSNGPDLFAGARCFTADGVPADSRFTMLLSGARPYEPTSRLGFVRVPDFAGTAISLDTSGAARNSATGAVNVGHNAVGEYSLQFPGLVRVAGTRYAGPENSQVTALGTGPERCRIVGVDASMGAVAVSCTTTGGIPADSRFSFLWIQRGRAGTRFGYAWADQPSSTTEYAPDARFTRNSSGGQITAQMLTLGHYRIVFGGQARPAGGTETFLISIVGDGDKICTTDSWGNSGPTDLAVLLACFTPAGMPTVARFGILMVE